MKIWKIFTAAFVVLILMLIFSINFWYGYPNSKISFFAEGQGEVLLEFEYRGPDNNAYHQDVYLMLEKTPQLEKITLKTPLFNSLRLNIKHYNGNFNIADVFISGKHFTDLQVETNDNVAISSADSNSLGLNIKDNAQIKICDECITSANKIFKPWKFSFMIFCYLLLGIFSYLIYLKREFVKEKLSKVYLLKNYALIFPFVKPYLGRALLAIFITIPVGAMDAVIAWSLKPFMDVVLIEKQEGWTVYIPFMIVVFSVLQALFTYMSTYMNTWVGNKIALDMKRKLFNKLLHNDASFYDTQDSGNILFRFNMDAELACSGLLNNMRMFSTRFFSSLSLIFVLLYNSWQLAIVAIIILFGALYPLTTIRKRLKKLVCKDANVIASLMRNYNEAYSGNRIITSYNLFSYCREKFVTTIEEFFNLSLQMVGKVGIISPIMHTVSSLGIAFVIWYGSNLIVTHQITVGNFVSFLTSLVMLYNPIKSIGNTASGIVFSLMAVERVFEVLNDSPKIKEKSDAIELKPQQCRGDICYENVSFAYNPENPVLKNINLNIKHGQTIALVGNSGGGKTTISALLPRFYDVKEGKITIDGTDIRDIKLNDLRENISIVFQDNFLFGGTIRENILLGRQDVSDEQLKEALSSACLDEFINSLEAGLDTQIGERGVMLSGGQRQRVAIARAFIKNAPILILDEATSALDNKSEAVVQQALDNLMKNRTVLVIAHRLSTVKNADTIVVINNGRITELGKHDELIKNNGDYAALYKTQLA